MYNFEKKYWDSRYERGYNSGNGSYGDLLYKKLQWLMGLDIESISDIGCGDFNFGKDLLKIYPNARYVGQDISKVIIEKNKKNYPERIFTTDINELPQADLLTCIDVLLHVIEDDELEALLQQIENKWTKYLAITAYERDEPMQSHVRIRKFDYQRFGKPIIRQIIEEDGQMYFYLFEKVLRGPEKEFIDLSKVSACLMTKDPVYPQQILNEIKKYPFGEVLILVNSDSPYNKYNLFKAAKFDLIYYQDDDAICPIKELRQLSKPDMINVAMKPGHFEQYKNLRMTMGLGWGAIFPKSILKSLKKYTDRYGEDELFKRDTEKILTQLNYPQNRLILPIMDLPSAYAPDRLWRQPTHWSNMTLIEERYASLV